MNHPIATFRRYIYLNSWAILLLLIAAGIAMIPVYRLGVIAIIIQAVAVVLVAKPGVRILMSWDDKKRKYTLLVNRNTPEFRPDTFAEFMSAPCGRLLVRVVLRDMGLTDRYPEVKALRHPWHLCRRETYSRPIARITIHPEAQTTEAVPRIADTASND
ncbi:MAG: hypothetical protein NC111_04540 [Bacteroides sp.]|nr:hypothetical protein [Bacteroides sp.]MCM1413071.1 hypothetical protein [Bacteroides sp.]MCM1471777.1 hypothetical protein [Bacteroides sp.]